MIEGVIFDADGTLIDSMPMWKNLDIEFLDSVGVVPDEGYTDVVNKMTLEEGVTYTKDHFGLSMTEKEIMDRIQEMASSFYRNDVELKPYVREFLEELKARNIPMVVATSSQQDFIEHGLGRNGALGYFKGIFSCADLGINKNFPDVYLKAAECIGVGPENLWVFEDAHHALMTAKNAGFKVAAVYDLSNETLLEETKREADIYLGDLREPERFFRFADNY